MLKKLNKRLFVIFLFAFTLRFFLISTAFHGDLYNNLSWGNTLVKYGPVNYYERIAWDHSAPNQPPLYIILFGLTSWIYQNVNNLTWYLNNTIGIFPSSFVWFWQQNGNLILLKLPGILADLTIGYLIYRAFTHYFGKNEKWGFLLATTWLLNPISFYNSAIWGQTDAIVNLLGLISIYFLLKKNPGLSISFYILSILFKGSLIIFAPIFLIVLILQKHHWEKWIQSAFFSLSLIIVSSVWFHPKIDLPIWLFNLYSKRFIPGEVGYLTANAFNFWYLIDPEKVLDSTKYFGITAHTIGYIIASIFIIFLLFKNKKNITQKKNVLFLFAVSALISFLFFTRIHERYLYPFFPVATILIGLMPEFIILYAILSVTFLLNMYNLFWAPSIPFLENILRTTTLPNILSIINLLVFGWLFVWAIIKKNV